MPLFTAESETRIKFFDTVFANQTGYLCIATKDPRFKTAGFQQKFFYWPENFLEAEEYIIKNMHGRDVYFCVNLLNKAERTKENCLKTNLLWADLDEVDPESIEPSPPIVNRTSAGRYQAIWRLDMLVDPQIAENYSRRIAYAFKADKSGWDLTQLLRIPTTFNYKYSPPQQITPVAFAELMAPPMLFELLPKVEGEENDSDDVAYSDVPTNLPDSKEVLYKYHIQLRYNNANFHTWYSTEIQPSEDWSRPLWKLIHTCLEVGMDETEVLAVVQDSPFNKYDRDKRPISHLWRDIIKAKKKHLQITSITGDFKPLLMPQLVHPDYTPTPSFITKYRAWAEESTDAVPEFHDLSAFILLSAIISNSVKCLTSYGPMIPNLWGMLLGDSTLSRKTTAMRMVMEILNVLNNDFILATDGSAEGLLGGLEQRPNRTSIFFRDELSGLFDSINRKDYLAGMPETLTHLYDVPDVYTRRLRKETIRLESPIFIFFGGGVRDKVYEVTTEEYVISGFLPRFLVVSGNTELADLRRTGPATDVGIEKRAGLITFAADLYEAYASEVKTKIGNQTVELPPRIMAYLTDEAWLEYGRIEELMVRTASGSSISQMALPTFERLSRSLLKMSMCLAAARQQPKNNAITVELVDVKDSAYYIERWGPSSIDLIMNSGRSTAEKLLTKIVNTIKRNPGILRSTIMQHNHLSKKQADDILSTLEDRMLVYKERTGNRGSKYWAV